MTAPVSLSQFTSVLNENKWKISKMAQMHTQKERKKREQKRQTDRKNNDITSLLGKPEII